MISNSWLKRLAIMSTAGLAIAIAAGQSQSQGKYPQGTTITMVTHSKAGGGTDVFLREMVKHLAPVMGTNFAVENVTGGSGARAMAKLATAKPDGTLFYGTTPTYINTSLLSKPKFTYKDLEPMVNVFLDPQIVYVRAESKFNNITEVIAAAKAKANSVKFGVTTPGSLDRQVMEKFKSLTGVQGPVVTHDGGGELLISVLNGTVDLGIGEIQELSSQLEAKKVRIITTYTEKRLDQFPNVMTAREQGVDLVVNKFRGIAAPKGQPPEVIAAWEKGIQDVLKVPAFKKWYTDSALVPHFVPHSGYGNFIEAFAKQEEEFLVKYNIKKSK